MNIFPKLWMGLQPIGQRDITLWLLVLISMVLDIVTTLYGLHLGFIEQNPVVVFGIETFGYAILAFMKAPAILLGLLGHVILSKTARRLNLIGLALPWIAAVLFNGLLILFEL